MRKLKILEQNENTTSHSLWEAVLGGKYVAMNEYSGKEERSQINNPSFHLRKLEESKLNPKLAEEKGYEQFKMKLMKRENH